MHGKQDARQRGKVAPQSGDRCADAREQRTGDGVQQHIGDVKPAGVAAEQRVVQPAEQWKICNNIMRHCAKGGGAGGGDADGMSNEHFEQAH